MVPRITRAEMAALEEANLHFPGSHLVEERVRGEGEGWGFDNLNQSAMVNRRWSVDGDAGEVRNWYRKKLAARGWTVEHWWPTPDDPVVADSYRKGSQTLVVRLFGRGADRPFWMYWPQAELEDAGLHYDITLSDSSSSVS